MPNSTNNGYDKASIVKDIEEREAIIQRFYATGELDREDAIRKLQALQSKDADAAASCLTASRENTTLRAGGIPPVTASVSI